MEHLQDDGSSDEEEEGDDGVGDVPANVGSLGSSTTYVERKKKIRFDRNISQLISTSAVSSFTHKKLHPDANSMIPTILINKTSFIICLYDSIHDVLLISHPKNLCTKVQQAQYSPYRISQSGALLMWIVVNHR